MLAKLTEIEAEQAKAIAGGVLEQTIPRQPCCASRSAVYPAAPMWCER